MRLGTSSAGTNGPRIQGIVCIKFKLSSEAEECIRAGHTTAQLAEGDVQSVARKSMISLLLASFYRVASRHSHAPSCCICSAKRLHSNRHPHRIIWYPGHGWPLLWGTNCGGAHASNLLAMAVVRSGAPNSVLAPSSVHPCLQQLWNSDEFRFLGDAFLNRLDFLCWGLRPPFTMGRQT